MERQWSLRPKKQAGSNFFKKIGPSLFFLAAGTTDTKVRRSTGVTTANSTNKYQKYKSVELGNSFDTLAGVTLAILYRSAIDWHLQLLPLFLDQR